MDSDDILGSILICTAVGVLVGILMTRASDSDVKKLKKRIKHIEHVIENKGVHQ